MTFIIRKNSNGSGEVENTESTTARFNQGKVRIGGDFTNSGKVEIDIRADLEILGNLINSGNFHIKDYIAENEYKLIENAINELDGEAKKYLEETYRALRRGEEKNTNIWFGKFTSYLKEHPQLITGAVQILLQIFK
jgi:hypothetical protein